MGHPAQIPLTPQTDERNFPVWEKGAPPGKSGHAYPKMLTKACTKEDRDEWLKQNVKIDRNTREEYWEDRVPRVGTQIPLLANDDIVDAGFAKAPGQPLIAESAADEALLLDMLGIKDTQSAAKVAIPMASSGDDDDFESEADAIEAENERLAAAIARNKALKKQLAAETAPAPARKPKQKRRKRRAAAKAVARTLEEMASGDD